ncbi:MAG: transporter substrate-binding domain-containing protein [Rhodospirillaceae bacterium]|jgi:PAS domain S-box-containing protein|nr:transporter substrate-binding domain-containing protein [Rhodospirillaceae bacterium]MBT5373566.1 transporter substrate-binding domain-containing protein [Rhodospirillaceae bacterium]MBT5659360.1 transporter substrate-binding domain-containing protein [Rhodospirillaceae bacterium]MBT5751751.1 transporter substrate-binding domain-containing protein [Rhodospirillaceae bacterium]
MLLTLSKNIPWLLAGNRIIGALFFCLLVSGLLFFPQPGWGEDRTIDLTAEERAWIKAHSNLVVANETDWPPFDFLQNGKPAGYSIDLINLAASKAGLSLDFLTGLTWSEIMDRFRAGEIDILPAVYETEERRSFTAFTDTYAVNPSVLVINKKRTDITDLDNMAGKTIAAIAGYAGTLAIEKRYPEIILLPVKGPLEGLKAVSFGTADGFVDTLGTVTWLMEVNFIPDIKILGESPLKKHEENLLRMGVAKDRILLAGILQKALDAVTREEKQTIRKRWLPLTTKGPEESAPLPLSEEERLWVAGHKEIRLGIDPKFAPFEFFTADGEYQGMCADYVRLVAGKLGIEMKIVSGLTWNEAVAGARAGTIDVLPCVGESEERKQFLTYTAPHLLFPRVIITRIDSPFVSDLEALGNAIVGVQKESSHHDFILENTDIDPALYNTIEEALLALSQGEIDAVIGNVAASTHTIQRINLTNLKVAAPVSSKPNTLHFAVRQDWPELVALIDKAIATVSPTEKLTIKKKWLGVRYEHGVDVPYVLRAALLSALVIGLILLVFTAWNRRLRKEIEQRKEAEIKLEKSRESLVRQKDVLQAILDSLSQGVAAYDQDLNLLYWNENFLGIRGYPRDWVFLGQKFSRLLRYDIEHDEFGKSDLEEIFDKKLNLAKKFLPHDFERQRPDGRFIDVKGGPIPKGGFVSTYADITERKKFIEALAAAKEEAEHANSAKSRFISGMNHEMRTPLTAIIGFSTLLIEADQFDVGEKEKKLLKSILSSGQHLLELINEILNLASIESGKVAVVIDTVDLSSLVTDALDMIAHQAEKRGIHISVDLAPAPDDKVLADPMKLKQVLLNLLSNAVKYNNEKGTITLTTAPAGDGKIRISVADSGPGIPQDKLDQIFEPFNRLGAEKGKVEGTGIGLTITKSIIESMNGSINIESTPGEGTTFWVELPSA